MPHKCGSGPQAEHMFAMSQKNLRRSKMTYLHVPQLNAGHSLSDGAKIHMCALWYTYKLMAYLELQKIGLQRSVGG